jgi:hypothetical protein
MAVSAVDIALWDVKTRLLGLPLVDVLPRFHHSVPIYGSGGFTSYSLDRLHEQLASWAEAGIPRVKMKVGREPDQDAERAARSLATGTRHRAQAPRRDEVLGPRLTLKPDRRTRQRPPTFSRSTTVSSPSGETTVASATSPSTWTPSTSVSP